MSVVPKLDTFQVYKDSIAKTDLVTFIDFTATWCGPCQTIGPYYNTLAQEFEGKAHFFKLDVDANDQASSAAGITCMPTFMAFKGSTKISEMSGASKEKLKAFVTAQIAAGAAL